MQTLPPALVDRLRSDVEPSFLVEDFVFTPGDFPSLGNHRVMGERVVAHGVPRTLHRTVHIHDDLGPSGVGVGLCLGVDGAEGAFEVLLAFCGDFSRTIPVGDVVILQDEAPPIGDTGLAWGWTPDGPVSEVAWMRGNLLVTLTGQGAADLMAAAREIDEVLATLDRVVQPGGNPYLGDGTGEAAETEQQAVAPGGTLVLHLPPNFRRRSVFFFPEQGSVNFDPDAGAAPWYYRAGLDPAESVDVDVLAVGPGIVPAGTQLSIRVA